MEASLGRSSAAGTVGADTSHASLPTRRSGVQASREVAEIEARLKSKGAHRIYALVDRRSKLASPFWKAAGYSPDEVIAQYSRNMSAWSTSAGELSSAGALVAYSR